MDNETAAAQILMHLNVRGERGYQDIKRELPISGLRAGIDYLIRRHYVKANLRPSGDCKDFFYRLNPEMENAIEKRLGINPNYLMEK